MFVFPAFNESYKTRKRTFRCCKNCRVKRVRCIILDSSYELEGCDNCRAHKVHCDLVKSPDSKKPRNPNSSRTGSKVSGTPGDPGVARLDSPRNSKSSVSSTATTESTYTTTTNEHSSATEPLQLAVNHSVNTFDRISNVVPVPRKLSVSLAEAIRELPLPAGHRNDPSTLKSFWDRNLTPQPQSIQNTPLLSSMRSLPVLPHRAPQSFSSPYNHIHSLQLSGYPRNEPQLLNSSTANPEPLSQTAGFAPTVPDSSRIHISELPDDSTGERKREILNSNLSDKEPPSKTLKKEESLSETYSRLADSIDKTINEIDHKFLKRRFGFNSTIRQSKYHFTKAVIGRLVPKDNGAPPSELTRTHRMKSKYLNKSNLLHFKFLLSLHAFTLNTPGFCNISDEDLVKLFEIYFYKVNSILPIVFEAEFWELHKRKRIPNIIMYAIVLLAASDELSEPILARSFCENGDSLEDNCARFLRELEMKTRQLLEFLPEIGDTEKLARLITLLLLSLNFRSSKIGNEQSSSDIGDCISYAYSLLIHNQHFHDMIVQMGALKKSVYLRNLWWVVFTFDRFNGVLNGKAMFIKRLDFNIQRPLDTPHLDRLVLLAYALEDTMVAGFRPGRILKEGENTVTSEYFDGDPTFDPSQIISDEIKILEDPEKIKKELKLDFSAEVSSRNHLPNLEVEKYRNRNVFFMERLIRHQILLILRTGLFKNLREASQLDEFSLKLSKRLFEMFQMLKGEQNHKLVMTHPMIPLILLLAFSIPSFARSHLLHSKGQNPNISPEMMNQITMLSDGILDELKKFSKRWWFVHEVIDSLVKKQSKDSTKTRNTKAPHLDYFTPKDHMISIKKLVRDVGDAECVLPSLLSITSPGFYDDVMQKEESDVEEDQTKELSGQEGTASLSPVPDINIAKTPVAAPDYEYQNVDYMDSIDGSTGSVSIADDLNFDVAQLAEMVSADANFIPNVMDYFSESQLNFFF